MVNLPTVVVLATKPDRQRYSEYFLEHHMPCATVFDPRDSGAITQILSPHVTILRVHLNKLRLNEETKLALLVATQRHIETIEVVVPKRTSRDKAEGFIRTALGPENAAQVTVIEASGEISFSFEQQTPNRPERI